ncbi:hypothetical protein Emed_001493 [Eimeria media]
MTSLPLRGGPVRAPASDLPPRDAAAAVPAGIDASTRTQQVHHHPADVRHPLIHVQEPQAHQAQRHGRAPQLMIPPRVRQVSWHAPGTSSDDEEAAVHAAEAKVEVALQCRPKEDVLQSIKDAVRTHPKLSAKHRDILGNTVKGLIAERRVSYYLISAMRAVMSAAAEAWRASKEKGVEGEACIVAAGVAAELTILGVSPKEAGEKAAETAASRGVGAVKNLVLQHRAEQQRQQHAAAAAAALRRAQEAEEDSTSSSEDEGEAKDETPAIPENTRTPAFIAQDSAAAVSHGVHIPQQLIDTATSESVLKYAAYYDKRLEIFIALLIEEMRDLATSTWKLVEEKLLKAADSKEAKVFYLQLSADAVRYASQVVLDSQEAERLRRQSLQIYQSALALFDSTSKEGEEEEILLSTKMGLQQQLQQQQMQQQQQQQQLQQQLQQQQLQQQQLLLLLLMLLHDEPDGVQKAIDALAAIFREAVENVVHITDTEESRRVMMVLSLLRGNVEAWCEELGRTDATVLLGLDGAASSI